MTQSTQRIIPNKIGLLNLAEELGSVSKACQMMDVSCDTFYRCQSARDEGGIETPLEGLGLRRYPFLFESADRMSYYKPITKRTCAGSTDRSGLCPPTGHAASRRVRIPGWLVATCNSSNSSNSTAKCRICN